MHVPPDSDTPVGKLGGFWRWLTAGAAGIALFFAVSAYLPDTFKFPGILPVVLGMAAGWGLGRWGVVMNVSPTTAVAIAAWFAIFIGEILASGKTHHDGVRTMREQPQWQENPGDPVSENLKQYLAEEPANVSDEARESRQTMRAIFERGEAIRRRHREYLTFYGYLAHRIPKQWGQWSYPWPAVFWGGEVLLGSTLGAWLVLHTLRSSQVQRSEGNG